MGGFGAGTDFLCFFGPVIGLTGFWFGPVIGRAGFWFGPVIGRTGFGLRGPLILATGSPS